MLALLPIVAAVPPEAAPPARDRALPVAIAQPLAVDGVPLITVGGKGFVMLPEPGMLVLVGSALLGLAAIVRRTT